jgi:peptidoglycan/xylan/chitin deacetylase (PgdA/CDA1 family)
MTGHPSDPPLVVTIVMYHVVRPNAGIAAGLKGLDADAFRGQLDYIRARYTPIDLLDVAAAAGGGRPLPPRPVVLTFDDGYAGHRDVAFPLLRQTGTPATFFPVASSMLDGRLLDVNKIQLILASGASLDAIVGTIDRAVLDLAASESALDEYRARWWAPSRWDPPEVVYVKRSLQDALPEDARRAIVDRLFERFVSADARAIAAELYMSPDAVRELREGGMTIGAHGDRHVRLSTLSRSAQAAEIDGALRVLDAVDADRRAFSYCYANGDYNDDSVAVLRARGCRAAVTTRPALAHVSAGELLTLPRLDTNDLPTRADAAPNDWTRRAAAGG